MKHSPRKDPCGMDAQLRAVGRMLRLAPGTLTPSKARAANRFLKLFHVLRPFHIQKQVVRIPRGDGTALRLCVYRSAKPARKMVPGLLWMHGGGYLTGVPELSHGFIRRFIRTRPCVVAAPDYRLGAEAPYPAALEDVYAALTWLRAHARDLGVRENQLFIGGDSAGGGLTAALAAYARDLGEVAVAYQMPLYPMLDDRMSNPSAVDNHSPAWNSASNYYGWKAYLGGLFETEHVPQYAAAARTKDFRGLPPAFTFVGTLEPFYDETVAYVAALRAAGVEVCFQEYEGCYHAFDQLAPFSDKARSATALLLDRFSYAARHYFADQPKGSKSR